jgi:hypothetical protein
MKDEHAPDEHWLELPSRYHKALKKALDSYMSLLIFLQERKTC